MHWVGSRGNGQPYLNFTKSQNSYLFKQYPSYLSGKVDSHIETPCTVNTILSTCDIKSLHTNITHNVFYKAIEYWIDKFHDDIPLLSRFTKAFILEGLNIILKFNYFYIDENVFHQIKGTPMGTIFAVVGINLTVAYFEVKMFALLP